jgi:hypothetical protein
MAHDVGRPPLCLVRHGLVSRLSLDEFWLVLWRWLGGGPVKR